MKRNGLRTVVVLALTIFLLNAPVCATASRLRDTCAEARDEVALRPEWMRILHDTLPICKISIPGSHDSGSIKGGHMLKTQATDIPAQLRQGIRAFDIRLEKKGNKLGFTVMPFRIYIGKMMFYLLLYTFCKHILLRL